MDTEMTFENGVNGIEPNEAALSLPWVAGASKYTRAIEEMKEDNFYPMDTDSITNTIGYLSEIDQIVKYTAIAQYNDNLEIEQKQYYRKYLRNLCEQYNRSGENRYVYAKYFFDTETGFERRVELGRFEGDTWVPLTAQIKTTEQEIPSMTEYDTINTMDY